jgi:DNA helicase II / ATP-dependent DNA helicase PcrA
MKKREGLNEQQRQAVEAPIGPVLITAGPGTGKTKTLIARIGFLLTQGTPADRLLALTFTKKAADEMKARFAGANKPNITTFHALCHQLLTEIEGEAPKIISSVDRRQIIQELKKTRSQKGLSTRELELRLSQLKNRPEQSNDELLQAYQQALAERKLCDFDDLLLKLHHNLSQNSSLRAALQDRYRAILVDEFQDTNALQYEILKLLVGNEKNLFVIGDPLQSIYGFRGASAEVFDRFKQDWPQVLSVRLQTNYRSTPAVVQLGCQVFPDTTALIADRQDEGHVRCVQVLNEYSEANWVINTIEQSTGGSTMLMGSKHHTGQQDNHRFSNFAVLYRTHRTVTVLRRLLGESGLPYQVAGEGSPYTQPKVVALIEELKKTEPDPEESISNMITKKAMNLGFDTSSSDIRTLINTAVRFDSAGLPAYLDYLDDIAESEFYDPSADAITLLTIHAAKGLEFNHVFLIGTEDGILPHYAPDRAADIDEERRLFYVAVTRARDHIDLLHTKKRSDKPMTISSFASRLPSHILPRLTDPDMATEQIRLRKHALKRSQTTLF